MISNKDRSGFFGASDVDKIVGNTKTKTFEKWWLEKIGINKNDFTNDAMSAGTYYEHKILDSLGFEIEKDKQVIIEDLKLRVNLDGNTNDCIYEVKTYKLEKGFKVPLKYKRQVWVQMYATGIKKAYIVAYGLNESDYKNFFHQIEKSRLQMIPIEYEKEFIEKVYLPRLKYFAECLNKGVFPNEENSF